MKNRKYFLTTALLLTTMLLTACTTHIATKEGSIQETLEGTQIIIFGVWWMDGADEKNIEQLQKRGADLMATSHLQVAVQISPEGSAEFHCFDKEATRPAAVFMKEDALSIFFNKEEMIDPIIPCDFGMIIIAKPD